MPSFEPEDIPRLVDELRSLVDGESAVLKLAASGPGAIPLLRDFLLLGKPSNVFLPRVWAVEALARLGARDVLFEYLKHGRNISDPEIRLGEEAVVEAAARELAYEKTEDVFKLILDVARDRPSAGIVEVLGEFPRPESVPFLIAVLSDDSCRPAAEEALRRSFDDARALLLVTAAKPLPCADDESPSSLLRRRSALRLLANGGISSEEWPSLAPLVEETDPLVVVTMARMAATVGSREDRKRLAEKVLKLLPTLDWSLFDEAETVLTLCFDQIAESVEQEISSRQALAESNMSWDPILPALIRIRRRAEEARSDGG